MTRLGMLTPSSNTVLEPLTAAMLAGLPDVTAHFSRFAVTAIALSPGALAQFEEVEILRAARLLADARVGSITWNGTSGGWRGFGADRALCAAITRETGIPATTAMLALNAILLRLGVRRLGLVTPYTADVQARIIANYAALGIECAAERHLGLAENFAFAAVPPAQTEAAVRAVAPGMDAIAVVCTNLRFAPCAPALEAELGIPVLDTAAVALRGALEAAGADPGRVAGWGRAFTA